MNWEAIRGEDSRAWKQGNRTRNTTPCPRDGQIAACYNHFVCNELQRIDLAGKRIQYGTGTHGAKVCKELERPAFQCWGAH